MQLREPRVTSSSAASGPSSRTPRSQTSKAVEGGSRAARRSEFELEGTVARCPPLARRWDDDKENEDEAHERASGRQGERVRMVHCGINTHAEQHRRGLRTKADEGVHAREAR